MVEESLSTVPSIRDSIFSWCTPSVLFVFLNLMIGTIFVTSNFGSSKSATLNRRSSKSHRIVSPDLPLFFKGLNL
ncbi:hypothetical protein SLE2022_037260 [Rubroshorea leprosula]